MSHEHIENLLPAYAEGDLTAAEKSRVDAHLEGCESCRDALTFFTRLEVSLTERSELRPSDTVAASRIAKRIGVRRERRFIPGLTGLPAMVSGGLIVMGIVWFAMRGPIQEFFSGLATGTLQFDRFGNGLSAFLQKWTAGFNAVAVGSAWTWAVAYAGVVALILLSGSWMVLRYVRE
jgi:anti-sigma factor RsiW